MVDRRQSIQSRIYQYRQERKKFYRKVYIIAVIFILVSLAQWILVGMPFIGLRNSLKDYYFIAFPFLFAALILIMAFVMSNSLRFLFPANWIMSIVILECITLGMIWAVLESTLMTILICAIIVFVIIVVFIIIGIFIPGDLTLHVMILFIFSIVFFIGSIFFMMWGLLADVHLSVWIYMFLIALLVLMFVVYHAQTIHGGRFAEMRLNDFLLAALMIYVDYVIFFLLTLFVWTAYIQPLIQSTATEIFAHEGSAHDCTFCDKNITAVTIN